MKTILVTAGGTGTAWHICETIKRYFTSVKLIVCDINPKRLVPSATLADKFIQVNPINSPEYYDSMLQTIKDNNVDILIPLIDYDFLIFPNDNQDLLREGVLSTAPKLNTCNTLSNKTNLNKFLNKIGVATPKIYNINEIDNSMEYIIKKQVGFGSRGVRRVVGSEIQNVLEDEMIQEICHTPEITVDVVREGDCIHTVCRDRIEVKSGVCTKARVFYDEDIQMIMGNIAAHIEIPTLCCVQFMKNIKNEWSLTDFNLRSGAGTALSAAVGFEAVRAAINIYLNTDNNVKDYLSIISHDEFALRVYKEIVVK